MKCDRKEDKEAEGGGSRPGSSDHLRNSTTTLPKRRRLVKGSEVGLPLHASVIEETCEVEEVHTVLVRFPCFDFFRHVRVCERTRDPRPVKSSDAVKGSAIPARELPDVVISDGGAPPITSSHGVAEAAFTPEAALFIPGTLETDTPQLLLNAGTPCEMRFEGQWTEVIGEGASITNRAIVHVSSKTTGTAVPPAALPLSSSAVVSDAAKSPEPACLNVESLPASSSQATTTPAQPIASLLTHTLAGVTADEERRQRAEQRKGWTYDRIDVPSAVLVMHRVR
ncbi:conserved hypothetical protein [Leishmania braziliensis MHOM/BR/75/M2904]|uniref:Uncharacterized protein n=2 Tax=Leishmania braziliensis TaxID=5660 RepID=A4HFM2_LEIBR|nr:conserved hypothetical protein [Leishmania braziliensis MHOM/BR/75/M2904]CAJ2475212.1 unnamed protein product [Leishmania braziliensis]CAM45384.1 conserved hypothetical protein [Leishmania braziliensis MHOM/BR/75/M2904]SYZ67026.1 hypothetical_protein [Leishmania braziliensis MHOM/BR/75/M2904]